MRGSIHSSLLLMVVGSSLAYGQQAKQGGMTWEALVRRADANDDGRIARDEFRGPAGLFSRLDRNGDGVITQEEHREAAAQRAKGAPAAPAGKANATLPAPTHADVAYGPHERHVLDIWLARSDKARRWPFSSTAAVSSAATSGR
jgi:hypothetical protein